MVDRNVCPTDCVPGKVFQQPVSGIHIGSNHGVPDVADPNSRLTASANFPTSAASLVFSSYLGGNDQDEAFGIGLDSSGNAYLAGTTRSNNFPTLNPAQSALGGGSDVFVAKIAVEARTTFFSDGVFDASGWTATKVEDTTVGASATFSAGQSGQGGNPGSFRTVTHNWGLGLIGIAHIQPSSVYDPRTSGAIVAIAYAYDLIRLNQPGSAVAYGLLLLQGGTYYRAGSDTVSAGFWSPFGQSGLTANSFVKVLGPGPAQPEFSANGSLIQLGYISRNSNTGGAFFTIESGVDNWSVTIVAEPRTPNFPANSVVNGASFRPATESGGTIAADSIVSLFGTTLAASTGAASQVPLPLTLGDTSVTFNGIAAPLFTVSAGQINAQVPFEIPPGAALVQVRRGSEASAAQTISVASTSPGIFTVNQQGTGQGAVLLSNTAILAAPSGSIPGREARAVRRGEFISIFCSGLGDVTNRPPSGSPPAGGGLSVTTTTPTVTIGGVTAPVSFSGLTSFVGLYQVDVPVPANAPAGSAVPLVLSIGGVPSNTVTIAVE